MVKYKTWIIRDNFSKTEKCIFRYMCKTSKNIYNTYLFCSNVFMKYKKQIFKDVLLKYNNGKIITDQIENEIYVTYEKYYTYHTKIYKQLNINNNIIFKIIINYLHDRNIYVMHNNFDQIKKDITNISKKDINIKFDKTTEDTLFIDIINHILNSFFIKNYMKTKLELLNKQKITIADENFINFVKSNDMKSEIDKTNCKNELKNITKVTSDQNIITRFVYKHLGENLNKLPSDLIINIMLKANTTITSYFESVKTGKKTGFPKYLKSDDMFVLSFFARSRKEIITKNKKYYIRLTLGKYISDNYNIFANDNFVCIEKTEHSKYIQKSLLKIYNGQPKKKFFITNNSCIEKDNKHIIVPYYIKIQLPKKLIGKKIKEIEIVPKLDGNYFDTMIIFEDIEQNIINKDNNFMNSVSIDLGVINLMTIYDPIGRQNIINGKELLSINHYFNKKIDKLKSINKKNYNKQSSKQIKQLLRKREDNINMAINRTVDWFAKQYSNKKTVIIGYNINWKRGSNIGKKHNRDFYQIPYRNLINRIMDKLNKLRIHVCEKEESYTSKCDALALEEIKKHNNYLGKRIKRGCFKSATKKVINADVNGAINIMRKYYANTDPLTEVTGLRLCNPIKTNIIRETKRTDKETMKKVIQQKMFKKKENISN